MTELISLGLAEGAFAEAVNYARDREIVGRPIGGFQATAGSLPTCTGYRDRTQHPLPRLPPPRTRSPIPIMAAVAMAALRDPIGKQIMTLEPAR
jgi:hypothetical protein